MKIHKNSGFTILELLVVIAIIGILAAIVLPNFTTARIKGRDARRISDLKSIQLALQVYYDAHRSVGYPLSLNVLAPTYMPSVPVDPKTDDLYIYSALGSDTFCNSYHLGARVEGSVASGRDDNDAEAGDQCTRDAVGDEDSTTGLVFDGNAENCEGTSPDTPDQCYDLKP